MMRQWSSCLTSVLFSELVFLFRVTPTFHSARRIQATALWQISDRWYYYQCRCNYKYIFRGCCQFVVGCVCVQGNQQEALPAKTFDNPGLRWSGMRAELAQLCPEHTFQHELHYSRMKRPTLPPLKGKSPQNSQKHKVRRHLKVNFEFSVNGRDWTSLQLTFHL